MARKTRIYFDGAFYYVTQFANARGLIFYEKADYTKFLDLLMNKVNQLGHQLHAYCLLEDQFHLIIQVGRHNISKLMQAVSLQYSRYVNKKYSMQGYVFRGRYGALLFEPETQLLDAMSAVHSLAVKKGMAREYLDWPWTSYHQYIAKGSDICSDIPWPQADEKRQVIGSPAFRDKVAHLGNINIKKQRNDLPDRQLLVMASGLLDTSSDELTGPSRVRATVHKRTIFIQAIIDSCGMNLSDAARILNRDVSSVSRSMERMNGSLRQDGRTNRLVEKLNNAIMQT